MSNIEVFNVQCYRSMIERDRDIEERRRDEMAEKLPVYKREVKSTNHQSINCVKFSERGRFDHQSRLTLNNERTIKMITDV